MSNTRLIYCSKETAEVSNEDEGSYTNSVDDGIIVKVGDEISVEQIAINSVGVGAEIIEIPKTIKGYRYKTNAMTLNCAIYIHHNLHPYTVMLPLYGMNTINTTQTSPAYGYMEYGGTFPPTFPWANIRTKYNTDMRKNQGNRFYIGSYIFAEGQTPQIPSANPLGQGNTAIAVPSLGVWEFMRTDLTFEVDTGYDNPANIANKITQDFHAGNATPQLFCNDESGRPQTYSRTEIIGQPYETEDLGVWTENTACYTLSNQPPAYINQTNYSLYQSNIAYQNPFYAYYGTRLLSNNADLGGTGDKNNGWLNVNKTGAVPNLPLNNAIYWLDTTNTDITQQDTVIALNTILTTNIPYDYFNCSLLRDFIHSQKQYPISYSTNTEQLNTDTNVRDSCFSLINWGRVSDASVDYLNRVALQSPLQANGFSVFVSIQIATFFNEKRWGTFNITEFGQFSGFKIAYDYITPYNSQNLSPYQLSKQLDILVVPVLTGVFNGIPEYNIGVVSNGANIPNTRCMSGDFGLIDMSFYNVLNPSLLILGDKKTRASGGTNPPVIGDYATTIQVGSPNVNMLFDETRGRFAFENMCWNNMLQNPSTGTTVNASAGQEAIQQGYKFSGDYQYHTTNGETYGTKFGQSGIGILDISVLDNNYNQIKIDYYDDNDIKEKYNNSLLSRLGFNYKQLTNKNGRPDIIFTQRTYETKKPIKGASLFPYPLTTNLRFDTSIDIGLSNNGSGGLPMFDLFSSLGFAVNTSAVSDRIYALNLPKKLENPFWLIQSDVIDGIEFNSEKSGGGNQNILAVCNRAYLAGDFAFSFSTNYAFKATKEFVISGIKTAILNPDLTPADINEATTIIYKIVSPSAFFVAQEKAQEQIALNAQKKKK